MKKKIIALLCIAAMTSSLVPVAAEETKEPVTLSYWYRNNVGEQEYTQQVEDKLNEMLASTEGYEHITIDLHPCKDYQTDLALALAAGEQIDLISLPGSGDESEHIKDGILVPLDDYLAANPEITAELPDWLMELAKYDGTTYYVPNYQQSSNQYFLYMNKENFEATGYDYDEVQQAIYDMDMDYLYQFMEDSLVAAKETIKKDYPDTTYIGKNALGNFKLYIEGGQSGFPSLSGQTCFYWDFEKEEIGISFLREDVQAGLLKNGEWVAEGLLPLDGMTNSEPYNNGILGEYSCILNLMQSFGTTEMFEEVWNANESNVAMHGEIVSWKVDDYNVIGCRNAAQGVGVSATSEHPEEAANFLALLYNSKYSDFYNTLCYGLEGIHYNVISDGVIETTEFSGSQGGADTTYCYFKWQGGNTFNAWLNQSMTQEQEDYILNEINEGDDTIVVPIAGIVFDTKSIDSELTQMKAVIGEYYDTLTWGVKGEEQAAYLQEFLDKMEKAGMSKVLDELNAQADAYLASK